MPAGAPRKPADANYPKRQATRAAKDSEIRQGNTISRGAPSTVIDSSTIGVVETPPDLPPDIVEASYICNTCESPITHSEASCPVCKASLDWRGL